MSKYRRTIKGITNILELVLKLNLSYRQESVSYHICRRACLISTPSISPVLMMGISDISNGVFAYNIQVSSLEFA